MSKHQITHRDLFLLVSSAKAKYNQLPNTPYVSGKEVEQGDLPTLAVAEAFLMYLNEKGLLTKEVGFAYSDSSEQYEVLED